MSEIPDDYLAGLPPDVRAELARVNRPGLRALRDYLASADAVAFLGARASAPPYPLWDGLIGEMIDAAEDRMSPPEAEALRALGADGPEEVVEILRERLGVAMYFETLRGLLRIRTDARTGRTWTPVIEQVCRCNFRGVITTAYDPGVVDARVQVRRHLSATGFTTWQDELGLDRWRTGEIFTDAEFPVLFAHGHQGQPDSVVLATTEYRRAYSGKLSLVLSRIFDCEHVVWIGFSFADQRIATIIRETAQGSGTRAYPGGAPRHVAILPWDPGKPGNNAETLARKSQIGYGALAVLYPAAHDDHSALTTLLASCTDGQYAVPEATAAAGAPVAPSAGGHVFMSYSKQNASDADRLHKLLEAAGIKVWRDTSELWPGEDWRLKVRQAIRDDTLVFLACFSAESLAREVSYQNEELLLAIDQLRLRRPGQPWLIPVRFNNCAIPDIDVGAGRSLDAILSADLFGPQYDHNATRLVASIHRILRT